MFLRMFLRMFLSYINFRFTYIDKRTPERASRVALQPQSVEGCLSVVRRAEHVRSIRAKD